MGVWFFGTACVWALCVWAGCAVGWVCLSLSEFPIGNQTLNCGIYCSVDFAPGGNRNVHCSRFGAWEETELQTQPSSLPKKNSKISFQQKLLSTQNVVKRNSPVSQKESERMGSFRRRTCRPSEPRALRVHGRPSLAVWGSGPTKTTTVGRQKAKKG